MGQPIAVTRQSSPRPGVIRFDINRTLTGMGHERYKSPESIVDDRPPDELARRLFAAGGVKAIHMYSNVVTVQLESDKSTPSKDVIERFADVIRSLYIHYTEGVTPSYSA